MKDKEIEVIIKLKYSKNNLTVDIIDNNVGKALLLGSISMIAERMRNEISGNNKLSKNEIDLKIKKEKDDLLKLL